MRSCAHPLRVGSLFPSVLPLTLLYTSVTGLQEAYLLTESLHNPQAGELSVRFRLLAPWGEFCYCDYPAVCGIPTQDKALTISCLCPFYLTHCHLFFISAAVKNIVCWYPGISYTQLLCEWLYFWCACWRKWAQALPILPFWSRLPRWEFYVIVSLLKPPAYLYPLLLLFSSWPCFRFHWESRNFTYFHCRIYQWTILF